ncbi:MAG: hypothetical protein KGI03_02850, partial [Patescibacteria group bacterium]|nr:hypothetical protein [Patescibacteria group bacterium]
MPITPSATDGFLTNEVQTAQAANAAMPTACHGSILADMTASGPTNPTILVANAVPVAIHR